jgi:hypothetical protein
MRNFQDVVINAIIVHVLVPKKEGLILSSDSIDLNTNDPTKAFIRGHILNVSKDNNLRAAKFITTDEDSPGKISNDLINNPNNLVRASQNFASHLYSIMEKDGRISPCDLAICLFHEVGEQSFPYLAILKLDPSSAFRNRIEKVGTRNIVNLEKLDLVFTSERLQKAALIKPIQPDSAYHLLLLDRQISKEKMPDVAEFFKKDFLSCELAYDSTLLTGELYKALNATENILRENEYFEEASSFSEYFKPIFRNDEFHLNQWINNLPYPNDLQELILREMQNKLHDNNFEIDRNISKNFYKKVRYIGDNGLIIEINETNKNDIIAVHDDGGPLEPAHWDICVETQKWERVK